MSLKQHTSRSCRATLVQNSCFAWSFSQENTCFASMRGPLAFWMAAQTSSTAMLATSVPERMVP
eukprot:3239022-Alexandrium_andersonii.AAC.1